MSAVCIKAGLYLHMSGRIFICKSEHLWLRRNFSVSSAWYQNATAPKPGSVEELVIPKKKTWDKLAILKSLASTVKKDPTAAPYIFPDDSYLIPRSMNEFRQCSLSMESGRNAAKYVINTFPKFFRKDFAEPHIPCLMPENLEPQIEEVCEAALVERIKLMKVKAAVDMYDQLLQNGTVVSTDSTNDLLDLICFYGASVQGEALQEELEDQEENSNGKEWDRMATNKSQKGWRRDNAAERIFNLMPEKNERAYCTLIRGMVKFKAHTMAFNTYEDMLNDRLTADVHTFNALISAAPNVRQFFHERSNLILELLQQMEKQKVRPNLLTFNAVLKSLRECGSLGRTQALLTLAEMKALHIEPSLATYYYVLDIFFKTASFDLKPTTIIYDVMDEVSGKHFSAQDPDDVLFFAYAMLICLRLKDIDLAYKLQRLLEVGNNWQLLGDPRQQSIYYAKFFNLLCMMEHIDVILKWYREITSSLYFLSSSALMELLQALDADNRLDLIPEIWKDIKWMGHGHRANLVEEVLALMARDKHSPEVQESFANCVLDVKKVYQNRDQSTKTLAWTASALGNITSVLLAASRTQEARDMLELFSRNNRVPTAELLEEFVNYAQRIGDPQLAVELVQLSNSFSLPTTAKLSHRVAQDFLLSDEQKNALPEMEHSDSESNSE
ncbi:hypothetical protein COCON_G00120230 [Conger conger]|uniref:Small ribosomal subunit protein mS39 n=1 Tax=Conger conger TaxID=82655 RepID=A0A9Q1DGS3_CONCO|nr:small ribosomal subunit protein mS39 [Conger conger]KAJ8269416.1 hypothetical protein COCON_G00120230 [Conger conger]